LNDLLDVWRYIAADNPEAADRVEAEIYNACQLIATSPLGGQVRADLTKRPLRFWILKRYPDYLIVYKPATSPLQVIRILHGYPNIREVLDKC
jgi:plasmid stabilization system protein ParE